MRSHNIVIGQKIGPGKAERAKELRHTMTPQEAVLWRCLRADRFHGLHFRRQQVIDGFIVDFYSHGVGLVVEVDGGAHRGREAYGTERDRVLAQRELRVLRVTNDDVERRVGPTLDRIADACGLRAVPEQRPHTT